MNIPQASVFVYVADPSCPQNGTVPAGIHSAVVPNKSPDKGPGAGGLMQSHLAHAVPLAQKVGARFDPDQAHRDCPSLWMGYCRANYQGYRHIMQVFPVSERTARKWWGGETAANMRHVATAYKMHPDQMQQILLIAAE